jgi:adenosine deaminase
MVISAELARRLRAMPKVEIHVHLEGATDAETVYQMAQRNQVALPAASLADWKTFYAFTDFNHFIDVYTAASRCMRSPDDFALMAERFLAHQARQNIRYSEAFLSVSHQLDKLPDGELLDALAAGTAVGEAKSGSRVRWIADVARHLPHTQHRVLDFALRGRERGLVIGLGLGGKEVGHPPEDFADTFAEARRQGLRVVAHAGETAGPASVRGAIEALAAERIGHGIRCLEDPSLVEELRARQTPLEVCPQSNYCLGIVRRGEPHPIRRMLNAGLYCTLNSDDPPMFATDLTREYELLAEQGFSWGELWHLSLNTLEASFLAEEDKSRYRQEWHQFALAVAGPGESGDAAAAANRPRDRRSQVE